MKQPNLWRYSEKIIYFNYKIFFVTPISRSYYFQDLIIFASPIVDFDKWQIVLPLYYILRCWLQYTMFSKMYKITSLDHRPLYVHVVHLSTASFCYYSSVYQVPCCLFCEGYCLFLCFAFDRFVAVFIFIGNPFTFFLFPFLHVFEYFHIVMCCFFNFALTEVLRLI